MSGRDASHTRMDPKSARGQCATTPRRHKCSPMSTQTSWLTVNAATAEAGISRATLYRYWALKVGPRYSTTPGGQRRVRAEWLADWLLAREVVA